MSSKVIDAGNIMMRGGLFYPFLQTKCGIVEIDLEELEDKRKDKLKNENQQ